MLAALVCLADLERRGTKSGTLLGQLSLVLLVCLALVLLLGRSGILSGSRAVRAVGGGWVRSTGVCGEAGLGRCLSFGNGLACVLVGEFGGASLGTPSVSGLLLVLAETLLDIE